MDDMKTMKSECFQVGKHGHVRLVDWMGDDAAIVQAARVSYGAGTKTIREDRSLIRYLMRKGHTSPFEHCELKLHVRVPMDVWRQWIRNRTACLSGSTMIDLAVPEGSAQQYTSISVKEAFDAINEDRKRCSALRVRCFGNAMDKPVTSHIAGIYTSGEKPVFQMLKGSDLSPVQLTSDHECFTNAGWLTLAEATRPGGLPGSLVPKEEISFVFVNPQTEEVYQQHDNICFAAMDPKKVYDVEIYGKYPTFTVGGGLVVHNSVNEYSTRYSEAIDDKETTDPDKWRMQSTINRQGSDNSCLPIEVGQWLTQGEANVHSLCRAEYEKRIKSGVAREQARKDLPLSNLTEAYWKIDLHNLLHNFLAKRLDSHAQYEIRQFAKVIARIVSVWVPLTWEAFQDYVLDAVTLSGPEARLLPQHYPISKIDPNQEGYELSLDEHREFLLKCARLGLD